MASDAVKVPSSGQNGALRNRFEGSPLPMGEPAALQGADRDTRALARTGKRQQLRVRDAIYEGSPLYCAESQIFREISVSYLLLHSLLFFLRHGRPSRCKSMKFTLEGTHRL